MGAESDRSVLDAVCVGFVGAAVIKLLTVSHLRELQRKVLTGSTEMQSGPSYLKFRENGRPDTTFTNRAACYII